MVPRSARHAERGDSAVLAAATNAGATYADEAKAVTSTYGFTDGVAGVSVTASDSAACPSGGNNCYSVTIRGSVPLFFSQVVGFRGTARVNESDHNAGTTSSRGTVISATAIASEPTDPRQYCILALATSGASEGIRTNGAPKANLAGCDMMSDSNATCNGHDTGADHGDAYGVNDGCGVVRRSNIDKVADPYSGLADNIPSDPCGGSYPQMPAKKKGTPLPTSNQWSATKNLSGNVSVCGDLQLTSDVTVNASSGAVLYVWNGRLDTNGHTLSTSSGSALTVVFTGDNSGGYTHTPTGGGILDIAAPTSGTWKGVALYQDPHLTSGVDISAAGNSPAWDITGLVYLPHASVTLSGAVNKASHGKSCFGLVIDNITINGTGMILDHGECPAAGLDLPTGTGDGRGELVG